MGTSLSLRELEAFDPHATGTSASVERRFLCPLCGEGKPKDSGHRSVGANMQSGVWLCHRCGEKGKLEEWWSEQKPERVSKRERVQRRLRRAFSLDPLPSTPAPVFDRLSQPSDITATSPASRELNTTIQHREPNKSAVWRQALRNLGPLSGTPAQSYLASRGISLAVAQAAGARFSPSWFGQAAVVFPVRNEGGELVAAQGRYLKAEHVSNGRGPKARTTGDKKAGIFVSGGFWDDVKRGAPIVVCEAPIDALSLAECGYPALALCGKDGWPSWLPIKCAFKQVALAFDADDAGDAGAQKLDGVLSSLGARTFRLRPEGGKDWNDLLQQQGREALADILASFLL
jgi:hypothetical protein